MKTFLIALLCMIAVMSFAQNPEALERIEAAKIALITERLDLTPEQAEQFWPIYREFNQKQMNIRNEFQEMKRNHDPKRASEEENQRMLQMGMKLKERQLDLEKTYSERMQQVISTRQLMSLRKAEDDFREMLMKRIRQQQMQRERMQDDRLRNQTDQQRRRNN